MKHMRAANPSCSAAPLNKEVRNYFLGKEARSREQVAGSSE
jgi:hypothetical protein